MSSCCDLRTIIVSRLLGLPSNDCSTTLRIKTKDDRWVSRTLSRILRLPKNENSKSPPVYRPPPQHYKGKTSALITQWLLYRRSNKKLTPNGTSRRTSSLGKALGTARKNSRSLSISRKLISRSSSTLQSGSTINLDSEVFRSNLNLSTGDQKSYENSENEFSNELKSKTLHSGDILSDTTTTSPNSKNFSSKTLRPSLLYKSMTNLKESSLFSDKFSNKLSAKSFAEKENIIYVQTVKDDGEKLRHKSFSSDSITSSYPNKKVKHSSSLWNLCPKTSVKRVISILF
ncbi:hypothetical protein Avbf_00326 [Armadillidium vulgare]|nr:hypothetical protein Avbf_00326 [Armadillidium vulgare]